MDSNSIGVNYIRLHSDYDEKKDYYLEDQVPETDLNKIIFCGPKEGNGDNYLNNIILNLPMELFSQIVGNDNKEEIIFGEYPQTKTSDELNKKLELIYNSYGYMYNKERLIGLGQTYTLPNHNVKKTKVLTNMKYDNYHVFVSYKNYVVYEYDKEKYIRVMDKNNKKPVWIKVEPIKWKIDRNKKSLVSKESFMCGILESYLYDASAWDYGLVYISLLRLSKSKTEKYLNKYFLKDLIQNNKMKQTIIEYHSYEELFDLVKKNNGYKGLKGFYEIIFEGPNLSETEKNNIENYIGKKIKKSFRLPEDKSKERSFDKFKLLKTKEKSETTELEENYKTVLYRIMQLKNAIEELEKDKITSQVLKERLKSSIDVPESLLIINVGDHREFNPDFIELLPYINLSSINIEKLKLSGLKNLGETNIKIDPQIIYNKDLSNTILKDHNLVWVSLKDVILNGADIEDEKESFNLDEAIIDNETKLPINKNKALK